MKLEKKEKALEDLGTMVEDDFKAVEQILAIKCEVGKLTGDISNVRYTEYELINNVDRKSATSLISLLVNEAELVDVRDYREEDRSITYYFELGFAFRMLVVELMIVWKDRR